MKLSLLAAALWTVLAVGTLPAAILLDFGPETLSDGDNSPAHSVGAVPGSETTWNKVLNTGLAGFLQFSGGGASTATLVMGVQSVADTNIIDYSSNPAGTTLTGLATPGGVWAHGTPQNDGVFHSGVSNRAIGLRIDGLAAGSYDLYFSGRNTNTDVTTVSQRLYASVGASAGTYDFTGGILFSNVTNAGSITNPNFVLGENYNILSVNIAEGQSLFLAMDGTGSDQRGFLNAIALVVIPEPGAGLLLGIATALGLIGRRRRRSL